MSGCRFAPRAAAVSVLASVVLRWAVAGSLPPVDPRLSPADDAYLNRQAEALLKEADETLRRVPPQVPEPAERRLALRLIDAVLHDPVASNRPPVQAFHHARIERAIAEMEAGPVAQGARIWKLYNHGFVVRTPTVTVGFDLHRGASQYRSYDDAGARKAVESAGFPISDEAARRLARQCDVLFVSHRHADHVDPVIIQAFLDDGKPVVAPDDVLEGDPLQARITHMKRERDTLQPLKIQGGARELQVVVYPGRQYQGSGVPNNVVVVFTPEGMSFAHNGDQINDPYPEFQEDFEWIDRVKDRHRIDVLMTNCWTNDLLRIVRGFSPKLVLPGHENELGHPLNDRVPYWGDEAFLELNYAQVKAEFPTVVMAWGESYAYAP